MKLVTKGCEYEVRVLKQNIGLGAVLELSDHDRSTSLSEAFSPDECRKVAAALIKLVGLR